MIERAQSCANRHALVVGTGPTGLAAALALAASGASVVLAGPPPSAPHGRTAALFSGSIALLRRLGVWPDCEPESAPITGIRLVDDTGGLLRAPEVHFKATAAGLDAFGFNVPNNSLVKALAAAVGRNARIRMVRTSAVTDLAIAADGVTARLAEGGALGAPLVVAADGRGSLCRQAAGIAGRDWRYPQCAVVTLFAHGRPHRGISSELHRRPGPLTVVPMPGQSSSLVWVETVDEAQRLAGLDDAAFRDALEQRLQGLLGSIGALQARAMFPLAGLTAERFAARRVALVGEAGHVLPPIGAQGLNLGMRDVAVLADCVGEAIAAGRDPGRPETLAAYDAARRADVGSRTLAVDLLNRSLIAGLLPADLLRGLAMHLVGSFAPLRDAVVRQGLQPSGELPRLMRD